MDLHNVVERGIDWSDAIPSDLLQIWDENFEIMKQLQNLYFSRAIIPVDAVSLEIGTIEAGDSSKFMIMIGIWTRILKKNGFFDNQLILGKSKLVPKDMTLARAELVAAKMNCHAGHIVHKALGDKHGERIRVSDSEITLQWINSWDKPLKQFVRGNVIDILRFSNPDEWNWVPSSENPSDLGTRRNVSLKDVGPGSAWDKGKAWMSGLKENFPTKTVKEIKLSHDGEKIFKDEFAVQKGPKVPKLDDGYTTLALDYEIEFGLADRLPVQVYLVENQIPSEVAKRLFRSKYVIDPTRFKFKKLIRVLSMVKCFIRKLKLKVAKRKENLVAVSQNVEITSEDVSRGEDGDYKNNFCSFYDKSFVDLFKETESLIEVNSGFISSEISESRKPVGKLFDLCFLTSKEIQKLREMVSRESKLVKQTNLVIVDNEDVDKALHYLFKKATEEVEHFVPQKKWKDTVKVDGVRYWTTRVLPDQQFTIGKQLQDIMLDISPTVFCVPILDQYSPIAWSVVLDVHWDHPTAKHAGISTVVRYCNGIAHIFNCSQLVQVVKSNCARCRYIRKKTIEVGFGPLAKPQLKIAPAYYVTKCDLFGPISSYSLTNARQTTKIWGCVFVCLTTSCVSIQVMESYSSASFVQAYNRFSCNNGHSALLLVDEGKNVECGAKEMIIDWIDVKYQLQIDKRVQVKTCPVGDHHEHGKVERKIQQIEQTILRSVVGKRLTPLGWQTVFDCIANSINNLPIARDVSSMSGVKVDVGNMDLITPNRLKFGRNNDKAPISPAVITNDPKKILQATWKIFEIWWKDWLDNAVPKLLDKPQRNSSDRALEVGDIVLLKKQEGDLAGSYRFGIIDKVVESADNYPRKVVIRYRNVSENTDRFTNRSVSSLVLIKRCDELNIWSILYEASIISDKMFVKDS